MTAYDHHAAAQELIAHLRHSGHAAEAAVLDDAIARGATGTEIAMALRFHVGALIKSGILSGDQQILAKRLRKKLEALIRRI